MLDRKCLHSKSPTPGRLGRTLCALLLVSGGALAHAQAGLAKLQDEGSKRCSDATVTALQEGPMAGKAKVLLANKAFAKVHRQNTQGEGPWLVKLDAYSIRNLVATVKGGQQVVVAAVCPAQGCGEERAFVAYEPKTGAYGATLAEGRQLREIVPGGDGGRFAEHPPAIDAALHCAREFAEVFR